MATWKTFELVWICCPKAGDRERANAEIKAFDEQAPKLIPGTSGEPGVAHMTRWRSPYSDTMEELTSILKRCGLCCKFRLFDDPDYFSLEGVVVKPEWTYVHSQGENVARMLDVYYSSSKEDRQAFLSIVK